MRRFAPVLLIAFCLVPCIAAAQNRPPPAQGAWRFEKTADDTPTLSFIQDGKVLFQVGAGRTISLWITYPGAAQPKGTARLTIDTTARRWRLTGDLVNEHGFKTVGAPATYFVQKDMGMTDRKKRFGNLSQRYYRFLDTLLASKDIVITTKAGTIRLPRIDIPDARHQMQL